MGYLFLIIAVALNAAANVLLKIGVARIGALQEAGFLARYAMNWPLLSGLVLFAVNVVFYAAALARLNLSVAYPVMMAGGVTIVVAISIVFLRESLSSAQMVGLLLVVVGLVLLTSRPLPH